MLTNAIVKGQLKLNEVICNRKKGDISQIIGAGAMAVVVIGACIVFSKGANGMVDTIIGFCTEKIKDILTL